MYKNILVIVLLGFIYPVYSQNDTISKHLYMEFEFNFDFLNNTPSGYKAQWNKSLGGEFDLRYNIKLGNKGLIFTPGFGLSKLQFYSNLKFDLLNNKTEIQIIPDNQDYYKNGFNFTFVSLPFLLRYVTKPNKNNLYFSFEGGLDIGYIVNSEIDYSIKSNEIITTSSIINNSNINPIQNRIIGRISARRFKIYNNQKVGLSTFLGGEYSLSSIFKQNEGPNLKYYCLGFGVGFIFE